jgi:mannose-6-phosphate isomerase-like protein (cupin superfamily)
MEYAINPRDVAPDDRGTTRLFDAERGCRLFSQRLLRLKSTTPVRRDDDEVLYVLEGDGRLTVDGRDHPLGPGTAVFVPRATDWSIEADGELEAVSVLVHEPEAASGPAAVIDLAAQERQGATAGRQFLLGATPAVGCESVTQFVGLVPPGRAPDHFHTYDEVIYVLDGEGVLEIGGERAPLSPGACVHLPARLVHCLANTGTRELRLLGVFRPAGSPAEAYYPDGTLAVVPDSRR